MDYRWRWHYNYSVRPDSFSYYVPDITPDDKPKEIAADVKIDHYHGNYFGIMRTDNLAAHCSYLADPQTASWLRLHIELGDKFEYVNFGDNYEKTMFRIKEAE